MMLMLQILKMPKMRKYHKIGYQKFNLIMKQIKII